MENGSPGSAAQEIQNFVTKMGSEEPGFAVLNAEPDCTEYHDGNGGWLDHVLASLAMEESLLYRDRYTALSSPFPTVKEV